MEVYCGQMQKHGTSAVCCPMSEYGAGPALLHVRESINELNNIVDLMCLFFNSIIISPAIPCRVQSVSTKYFRSRTCRRTGYLLARLNQRICRPIGAAGRCCSFHRLTWLPKIQCKGPCRDEILVIISLHWRTNYRFRYGVFVKVQQCRHDD